MYVPALPISKSRPEKRPLAASPTAANKFRDAVFLLVASLFFVLACGPAPAETVDEARARIARLKPADYPTKPIEIMVAYPVAGGLDIAARMMMKAIDKYTSATFYVNNRPGAAGMIGNTWLNTQAPNDGYVIGFLVNTMWTDALLKADGKWKYDTVEPAVFFNYDPTYWLVSATGPFANKSLKDILAEAKRRPGEVSIGTMSDLLPDFLVDHVEAVSGTKFLRVPVQGSAPGIPLLLGKHINLSFAFPTDFKSQLEAGNLKIVAVAAAARNPHYPTVETFNEALGRDDMVWQGWRYVGLPRGIPEARRQWLVAVLQAAMNDPELLAQLEKLGTSAPRDRMKTPAEVAAEVTRLVKMERDFHVRTGRLKQ